MKKCLVCGNDINRKTHTKTCGNKCLYILNSRGYYEGGVLKISTTVRKKGGIAVAQSAGY